MPLLSPMPAPTITAYRPSNNSYYPKSVPAERNALIAIINAKYSAYLAAVAYYNAVYSATYPTPMAKANALQAAMTQVQIAAAAVQTAMNILNNYDRGHS